MSTSNEPNTAEQDLATVAEAFCFKFSERAIGHRLVTIRINDDYALFEFTEHCKFTRGVKLLVSETTPDNPGNLRVCLSWEGNAFMSKPMLVGEVDQQLDDLTAFLVNGPIPEMVKCKLIPQL